MLSANLFLLKQRLPLDIPLQILVPDRGLFLGLRDPAKRLAIARDFPPWFYQVNSDRVNLAQKLGSHRVDGRMRCDGDLGKWSGDR